MSSLPTLYTEKQAAQYLGRSESFLRAERRRGRITFLRLGKAAAYRESDLLEYLDRQTVRRRAPLRAAGGRS